MSARSLNKAMLIGNLTRDPELRYTPQGTAVCSFGLATNRSWMPSDATERREETEFHRIVAWNKLAELCSQLLTKGRKVYIEGRLQTRSWETPDGEKRQSTEIVAEDMVILDSRKAQEERVGDTQESSEVKVVKEVTKESKEEEDSSTESKEDKQSLRSEELKEEEKKSKKEDKQSLRSEELKEKKDEEKSKEKEKDKQDDEIDIDDIPF